MSAAARVLQGFLVFTRENMCVSEAAIRLSKQRIDRVQADRTQEMLDGAISVRNPVSQPYTPRQNVRRVGVQMERAVHGCNRDVVFSREIGQGVSRECDGVGLISACQQGPTSQRWSSYKVLWRRPALGCPQNMNVAREGLSPGIAGVQSDRLLKQTERLVNVPARVRIVDGKGF